MNRKEMAELAEERFARRRGQAKGTNSPERTGGQVLKLLLDDEEPAAAPPPRPQIVLYLREGVNPADRNFTKVPNEMYPLARDKLTPFEEVLYRWAWRQSWGYGRNYCRFSRQSAFKDTSLNSDSTTRRALEGLRKKGFVVQALDIRSNPDVDQNGKLYRVFTPAEILKGLTDEGIPLADIPFEGVFCESQATESHPESPDNTGDQEGGSERTRVAGNQGQTEPGLTEPGGRVTESQVSQSQPQVNADDDKPEAGLGHTEPGHTDPPFKEDSLKDSLSPDHVIDLFYTGIGQKRISKTKRERGNKVVQELEADGFSLEDIAFAAEWTPKNAKEEVYDIAILKHTIGEAISARSAEQAAADKEREEAARVSAAEEERNRLEGEIQEMRSRMSKGELTELRKKAEKEIRESGEYQEQFITDMLITSKENEILRSKMGEYEG